MLELNTSTQFPDITKCFEKHAFRSDDRMISGAPEWREVWVFNHDQWRFYKRITDASTQRIIRLCATGVQVHGYQWEFPKK